MKNITKYIDNFKIIECLGVLFFVVVFSRLDYVIFAKTGHLPPSNWLAAFLVIGLVSLLFSKERASIVYQRARSSLFLIFVLATLIVFVILNIFNNDLSLNSFAQLRHYLFSFLLLLVAFIFYSISNTRNIRIGIGIVALFSTFINTVELFFFPGYFSGIYWRAGGFYINPNGAALAIVLGMIVSFTSLPYKRRFPYLLLSGLGVFLTLSRAGLIIWLLSAVTFWIAGAFQLVSNDRKENSINFALLIGITACCLAALSMNSEVADIHHRTATSIIDLSATERWEELRQGLREIMTVISSGELTLWIKMGYFEGFEQPRYTHNFYLNAWQNFGVIGVLLVIFFLSMSLIRGNPISKGTSWALALTLLVWALFDGQLLHSITILLAQVVVRSDAGDAEVLT